MSGYLGVRIVLGVEVDADSDAARNFVYDIISFDEEFGELFSEAARENFRAHYDFHVLKQGQNPDPEVDCFNAFTDLFHCHDDTTDGDIKCFRQACCLSDGWQRKMVVGIELAHVAHIWMAPQGIDFPYPKFMMIENMRDQLVENGFPTDVKTFFILDDCIRCT